MQPARHQIVARALGRAGGQDRRLKFGKALFQHAPADRGDDVRAQHDVGVLALAAQIEETVGEAHLLGVFGFAVDRKGQWLRGRQQFERGDHQLNFPGCQAGVDRILGALDDPPGQRHDALEPKRVNLAKQSRRHVDHALGDAVVVAQIDEQELAVVALPVHPAREAGGDPGVRKAQRAAGVGTIGVHQRHPARGRTAANTARSAALVKKPAQPRRGGWRPTSS